MYAVLLFLLEHSCVITGVQTITMLSKKSKYEEESQTFDTKWEEEFVL